MALGKNPSNCPAPRHDGCGPMGALKELRAIETDGRHGRRRCVVRLHTRRGTSAQRGAWRGVLQLMGDYASTSDWRLGLGVVQHAGTTLDGDGFSATPNSMTAWT